MACLIYDLQLFCTQTRKANLKGETTERPHVIRCKALHIFFATKLAENNKLLNCR